ncbi:MAG: acyl-CoA dehydrogenase family protein [Gammaproteobacteria bacterium]|nr:acyl-CoA dehydrogenase family protein [Gammaproteobacteria bacterium]
MNAAIDERTRQRETLLASVERIKPVLEAGGAESETLRTLPADAVAALRDEGLFALKVPAVLGGTEADPVTQMHVYEAVARIDPAAGWTCFIGCGAMVMTAYLSDACIERMWAGGRIPTAAAVVMPGRATREAGGYRIDGRWSWGSGINHAEWVGVHVLVENDGAPPDSLLAMLPAAHVEILDNWHVAGLKGTGSYDFAIRDRFVPESHAFDLRAMRPLRGGPSFRMGIPALIANEFGGFAAGVGRRALDEITQQALLKSRGYAGKATLADRPTFHCWLGEADFRLRAARTLLFDAYEQAWQRLCAGVSIGAAEQIELRAIVAHMVRVATQVASEAYRYGGGGAARLDNMLQRCARDLEVASVHLFASDAIFEQHGRSLLGATDLNPMV